MKKNLSDSESVYWLDDNSYVVESNKKWDVGEDTPFGGKVIKIEPLDYNKNQVNFYDTSAAASALGSIKTPK